MRRIAQRGDREEMTPIAPLDAGLVDQSDIGLVDQAGGAQGVARPLPTELGVRETPKLLVDQGKELIHGLGRRRRASAGADR